MEKKYLVPIMLFVSCSILLSIWLGYKQRKQSDALFKNFQMIDSSLIASNRAIEEKSDLKHLNQDLIQSNYNIASEVTATILYIDSLHDFALASFANQEETLKSILRNDQVARLKAQLLQFNKVVKEVDSSAFIINLNSGSLGSKNKPTWEEFYFKNTSAVAIATYLIHLKNQVLQLQQKLIDKKNF